MDLGGAERIVARLATVAVARGDSAVVCSTGGAMVAALDAAGVAHHRVVMAGRNPLRLLLAAWQLRRVLLREHPDVVHSINVKATVVAALAMGARRRRSAPLVSTLQGVPPHAIGITALALARTSDAVIACSGRVAERLVDAGVPATAMHTVANQVQARAVSADRTSAMAVLVGAPSGAPVVVGVGRLVRQKDWPTWLAVAQCVPSAWFVLAGDGPLRGDLARRSATLDNVRMLGRVDDVPALLSLADVYLATSTWEGLPLAMLEAQAAGVPCVVTPVDGVSDVVDGTTGVVIPPRDPAAAAAAISALLADPSRRAALARAAGGRGGDDEMVAGYARVHASVLRAAAERPTSR